MSTFDMSYQATNITRVRGDTFPFAFRVKDSNGTVVPITGYTFKLSVDTREEPDDDTTLLFEIDGVITDGDNGLVQFTLSSLQADQTPGTYYYDVEQIDLASKTRTILKGEWIVVQDVTKEA